MRGIGFFGLNRKSELSIVRDNLVLWLDAAQTASYPGSGTTWFDLTTNEFDSTLTNGPTFNSDNGGSIVLDGVDDFIQVVSDGKETQFETQQFTYETWYYYIKSPSSGASYECLWSYDTTTHTSPFYSQHIRVIEESSYVDAIFIGSNIDASFNTYLTSPSNPIVTRNDWNHIVWTRDSAGDNTIYVNGVIVGSVSYAGNITYYNQAVKVGAANFSAAQASGRFAQIRFYDKALSTSEVLQNFNATKSRFISNETTTTTTIEETTTTTTTEQESSLKIFVMDPNGYNDPQNESCQIGPLVNVYNENYNGYVEEGVYFYHNGENPEPRIGDSIFVDENGEELFIGDGLWYYMDFTCWDVFPYNTNDCIDYYAAIQILDGVVINSMECQY